MKHYLKLNQLLDDFRKSIPKTQEDMAYWLGVRRRTYSRWEKGEIQPSNSNIDKLAKLTQIPSEVLFRLSNSYPTLYCIKTRRYSLCPFDTDYVNQEILQNRLFKCEETGKITNLLKKYESQNRKNKLIDLPYYPYNRDIDDLLIEAAKKLPNLNIVIDDPKGIYAGHIISFPLTMESYSKLRIGKLSEIDIKNMDLTSITHHEPISIHIFSFFATNSYYVYCLSKRIIHFLLANVPDNLHQESILSRYVTTNDGVEYCKKFGMKFVEWGYNDLDEYKTEILPRFYEIKINEIGWLKYYKDKITNPSDL